MRHRALLVLASLVAVGACQRPPPTSPWGVDDATLQRDGVVVAYNLGCERGCDRVARGDVLWSIDDRRVRTSADVESVSIDGRTVRVPWHGRVILASSRRRSPRVLVNGKRGAVLGEIRPFERAR